MTYTVMAFVPSRPLPEIHAERQEMLVWQAYDPLLQAMFRHELGQPEKEQFRLAQAEHVMRQAPELFGCCPFRLP